MLKAGTLAPDKIRGGYRTVGGEEMGTRRLRGQLRYGKQKKIMQKASGEEKSYAYKTGHERTNGGKAGGTRSHGQHGTGQTEKKEDAVA